MPWFGKGKHAVLWSRDLMHPFESDDSLIAKLAWINDASYDRFREIDSSIRKKQGHAFAAIHATTPPDWRPPLHQLARALPRDEVKICPDCLLAGYHSDLPQILGLEKCPIHGCLFRHICRWCGRRIYFGYPEFRKSSIYVCKSCDRRLHPEVTVFLSDIKRLSDQRILAAFQPYLSGLAEAARKCEGQWYLHERHVADIYLYTTGYRSTFIRQPWHYSSILRTISAREYMLPAQQDELDNELAQLMRYDDRCVATWAAERCKLSVNPAARMPEARFLNDEIEYQRGTDPVKGSIAVREQLIRYMGGDTRVFPADYLFPTSLFRRAECYGQLRRIVACTALYQIFTQLRRAERIAAYLWPDPNDIPVDASIERRANLALRLGHFTASATYSNRVILRAPLFSWLPDFQFQLVGGMLRLRIFRFAYNSPVQPASAQNGTRH